MTIACPHCGSECQADGASTGPERPFRVRGRADTSTVVSSRDAATITRYRQLSCTPVYRRKLGGIEITVHETVTNCGPPSYTVRLAYRHKRINANTWEFSENIPSDLLPAAIIALRAAERFITRRIDALVPHAALTTEKHNKS